MVYLNFEKEFFSKENIARLGEANKNELDDEGFLFMDDTKAIIEDIDGDTILFTLTHPEVGYLSFDVEMTSENMLNIIEMCVKKLNRFKTVLEGLK